MSDEHHPHKPREEDPTSILLSDARVPPNDLDAEALVLSSILLEPPTLASVAPIISPEHFYSDANRKIFEAYLGLAEAGTPIDVNTVRGFLADKDHLQRVGGSTYLVQIMDGVPTVSNIEVYAKRIKNKWRLREFISIARQKYAEAYAVTEEDTDQFLEEAEQAITGVTKPETSTDDTMCHLSDAMKTAIVELQNKIKQDEEGKLARPRTGFTMVDQKIGGVGFGELVILAARPSMGKTSLAYQIALNTAAVDSDPRLGVLIVSAETTRESVAFSFLAQDARVDRAGFQTLKISKDAWPKLIKSVNDLMKMPILIDDRASPSVGHVRNAVRRAQAMLLKKEGDKIVQRLGLVVVDYLQLCDYESKKEGVLREQVVAHVARGLHRMGKDYGVGVVALSQLSRGVESRSDKRPIMSDLRESGEIEQAADKILFLYRDDYYDPKSEEKGIAEVGIAKSKGTSTGVVKLKFTSEWVRFDNLEKTEEDWEQ